ncbi:MAG: MBL fold metallo-hydrolase [Thermoplasmata archaeon]
MQLLALDGTDTIGGTKLLLHYDEVGVMLDFGLNYSILSRYYEEYMKPRTTAGLLDLVVMGILPDVLGLYREDVLLPDFKLKGPEVGKIDAILASHAHMDHVGNIGLLRPDIPVLTSAMSAAIMRSVQDSGKGEFGHEILYFNARRIQEKRGVPVLQPAREPMRRGRDVCILEGG